jgi:hypothetical protein
VRAAARGILTTARSASPAAVVAWGVALAGLALRLQDFGRYGFWNDEAWVALVTRVATPEQFWLALSITPIGWAALLKLVSAFPGPPEVTLRLLPLGFGLLTLWTAYRVGVRLAGGAAGVLALVAVAFEPYSVAYSRVLKHYTAETWFALLAFLTAIRFAQRGRTRDLVALALVLGLGVPFANSQLFLAPPLLVAAFAVVLARRQWRAAAGVALAGALVAAWDAACFAVLLMPRMLPSLAEYWQQSYVPLGGVAEAAAFIGRSLVVLMGPAGTPATVVLASAALVALLVAVPAARVAGLALLLLVVELATLSALRRVPLNEPRVMLFLTTLLLVLGATALDFLLGRAAARPRLWAPAAAGLMLLAWDLTAHPEAWSTRDLVRVEDAGPLIRLLERRRAPDDRVLVYDRSRYLYAYYQKPTPVLVPNPAATVGFVPLFPDERVQAIDAASADAVAGQAFAASRQVWFVGSRFRAGDMDSITERLAARGRVVVAETRVDAVLMAVRRAGS